MAFWSGETLKARLPGLIKPYNATNIDCASYVLHLGEQGFVTKDGLINGRPDEALVQLIEKTAPKNTVIIGTGQFAFLLTEEIVSVPKDALALISMKSGLKNKGLVNVSGFHVDPGFSGKLIFAVYNAGPKEIVLERNQPLFMIVFADLDKETKFFYTGKSQNQDSIKANLLEGMTGQVFSPMRLQREMLELNNIYLEHSQKLIELTGKIESISGKKENSRTLKYFLIGTLFTILLGLAALDWPKVMLGYLFNNAISAYKEDVAKDVSDKNQPITINQHITVDSKKTSLEANSTTEKPQQQLNTKADAVTTKPTK